MNKPYYKSLNFWAFNLYTWGGIAVCYFAEIPPVYWITFCWSPFLLFHGYIGYMLSVRRKK